MSYPTSFRGFHTLPQGSEGKAEPSVELRSRRLSGPRVVLRDLETLRVCCSQGVLNRDQFKTLLGVFGPKGSIDVRATNQRLRKLEQLELVQRSPWLAGFPYLIFPTKSAARLVGWESRLQLPSRENLVHDVVAADVCIQYIQQGLQWVSERQLRLACARGERFNHRPDGIVLERDRRIGIEIELSVKSQARWVQILNGHLRDFDEIRYYATPEVIRGLHRLLGRMFDSSDRARIQLLPAPVVFVGTVAA